MVMIVMLRLIMTFEEIVMLLVVVVLFVMLAKLVAW